MQFIGFILIIVGLALYYLFGMRGGKASSRLVAILGCAMMIAGGSLQLWMLLGA